MTKKVPQQLQERTVCNELLYKKVALKTKVSPKQVEELASYVGKYIGNVIKTGAFETVMIPGFGKFKVKQKMVQFLEAQKSKPNIEI